MKIIGIDPGETTGLSICTIDEFTETENGLATIPEWEFKQLGPDDHHMALYDLLVVNYPSKIVYERFENRGNQAARLVSCEYIGVIKMYDQAHSRHQELVPQSASQAKAFWTNDKLKAILLWKGNDLKHAMDATRHVLYYLMISKQLPEEYLAALPRTTG